MKVPKDNTGQGVSDEPAGENAGELASAGVAQQCTRGGYDVEQQVRWSHGGAGATVGGGVAGGPALGATIGAPMADGPHPVRGPLSSPALTNIAT